MPPIGIRGSSDKRNSFRINVENDTLLTGIVLGFFFFRESSSAAKGLPLYLARACFLTLPEFERKRKRIPGFRRAVVSGACALLFGPAGGSQPVRGAPCPVHWYDVASPGRVTPGVVRGWSSRLTATRSPRCIHPGLSRGWSSRLTADVGSSLNPESRRRTTPGQWGSPV